MNNNTHRFEKICAFVYNPLQKKTKSHRMDKFSVIKTELLAAPRKMSHT